jgi:hypothetical protein
MPLVPYLVAQEKDCVYCIDIIQRGYLTRLWLSGFQASRGRTYGGFIRLLASLLVRAKFKNTDKILKVLYWMTLVLFPPHNSIRSINIANNLGLKSYQNRQISSSMMLIRIEEIGQLACVTMVSVVE